MTDLDTENASEKNSEENPKITPEIKVEISPEKQALIDQIKSMRVLFDQAHEVTQKAQTALTQVKHDMHQIELLADEEIVKLKTDGEMTVYQIQQDLENFKRDAKTQIDQLRDQIRQVYQQLQQPPTPSPEPLQAPASRT